MNPEAEQQPMPLSLPTLDGQLSSWLGRGYRETGVSGSVHIWSQGIVRHSSLHPQALKFSVDSVVSAAS